MCISEFYLRANVTKSIDTKMSLFGCFFAHLWTVGTKAFIVILTCTFLRETFLLEIRYIKTKILQCLGELKLIFYPHVVNLGSFKNTIRHYFVRFPNQIRFKCPMNTKLGLLCLRLGLSLNGRNVTPIRGYNIIAVYNRFNIANDSLALYRVWCQIRFNI